MACCRSCFAFIALVAAPALGQLRVVTYNTLDGPTPGVHDNAANMQTVFSAIAAQSVNGIAVRPGVIVLQEQTATSHTNLAALLNTLFGTNTYAAVMPNSQPNDDRQAFVYDTAQVSLVGSASSVVTGEIRPIIRAQFRPVGYTSSAANFWVYGGHLMASDAGGRANQTSAMRANANALGTGAHAIFAGDFNMDSNQEQAWLNMVTGTGAGLAVDPLNPNNTAQTWTANSAFAGIHTQSTRVGSTPDNDGGATGGMDDRFDVQLVTQPMFDGEGLAFVPGSYRAFGNDGQHFNRAINAGSPTIPLGATVANALWDASDHLPVVADYQLPAKMNVTQTVAAPAQVIVGASGVGATFRVQNAAPVSVAAAADELDYTLTTTGAATGSFAGSVQATTPGDTRGVTFDTSGVGVKNATVTVSSDSQGVEGGSASFSISTQVLGHARPSFDAETLSAARTIDFGIWAAGSTVPTAPVAAHNVNGTSAIAGLDLDSVGGAGDTGALGFTIGTGGSGIPQGGNREGAATLLASAVGDFQAVYTIQTSDQDLPGATPLAPLTLTLRGRVALPGDASLDDAVTIADFSIVGANFNAAGPLAWQDGDFNRDAAVDIADFSILAANFNTSASPGARPGAVPEPAAAVAVLLCAGLAATSRRPRARRA